MSEHPTWFVGDMNPSISDTVSVNGVGVDLTSLTVTFNMRAVGASTTKVSAPVSSKDASGNWTYNWAADDLDTAGEYLVWVTVDMGGGALETVNESLIVVADHAPAAHAYVELEQFKSAASLTGQNYADPEIRASIVAASRGIDNALGRRFYADADATQIRYYTPARSWRLWIDDLVTLTELATDQNGGTDFSSVWTENTDFVLEPLNPQEGWPKTSICRHPRSSLYFPSYPRSVRVTGKFGWAAVPQPIVDGTILIAERVLKRKREAPFGAASFGVEGAVAYATAIARDSELQLLIGPYSRNSGIA